MSRGASVSRCEHCGWTGMPPRDWCPVCARNCVREARVRFGRVEQATIVRKGISGSPVRLGSVRLDGGGVVLARLDAGVGQGQRARLEDEGGAVIAFPV